MMNKRQRISKLMASVIGISALLALSACSGENTSTEEASTANEPADTTVAVADTPVAESEVTKSEIAAPAPETKLEPVEGPVTSEESVAEVTAEPEVLAADAGAKLYETNCKACHEAGLLDAPKYGDKAAWAARLTKGKDTLHLHSAKGFNKMPAQVTDKVSEAQVYAAVDYMIAAVS
ncbi:cytochrome c5 family protein [Psychrobacter sp. NZS113]|uniref:c-type cytochrome n=1 Tax=Psychrobacter sp. NZS113 TaxID=2792045 RepID=UPI0018CEEF25|nr:c-type cytochrome [Psychrobacter sp. NZS113]MBH0095124.1 cytochrome c5 family protein [Psychrobacter sp. NZS113]